ncbi:hypothetical protein BAUCODRAFT_38668 [Baudoinia panamericana UAMH 10762]|uniref:Uncharacterized protein n=1 Tax=Baudoinia panamericana (strain UAMH 10762) TaxID=717646 RepID=M2MJR1_BAUPA|nr:uncharacterized protein BAUCODRAFT_38668 [Baudoinia panamericana UAMH 10762]EMC91553.1 hypothetical protein BAUCODRAFT_38668 [Baudoinia panamericana UAMH 10762]
MDLEARMVRGTVDCGGRRESGRWSSRQGVTAVKRRGSVRMGGVEEGVSCPGKSFVGRESAILARHSSSIKSSIATHCERIRPATSSIFQVDGSASNVDARRTFSPLTSRRVGYTDAKTRHLFKQYVRADEPCRWINDERASKLRRVERPVRIRIHRICHLCQGRFDSGKACLKCKHVRCADCKKTPSHRVPATLDVAKHEKPREDQHLQAQVSTDLSVTPKDSTNPAIALADNSQDDVDTPSDAETGLQPDDGSIFYQLTNYDTRSRSPTRAKRNIFDRLPPSLCPSQPTAGKPPDRSPENPISLTSTAQRVYRKPRQRVRYSCDQCQAALVGDAQACQACGHARCSDCVRNPFKKSIATPEASVLPIVSERTLQSAE